MFIRIKTVDGLKGVPVSVSKATPVSELRGKLENLFNVSAENQRLFYKGKQLEDFYTIYDYDIRHNDVVQLLIKSQANPVEVENALDQPCSSSTPCCSKDRTKEDIMPAVSNYFEVGDNVDVRDTLFGAWFEGRIVAIQHKPPEQESSGKKTEGTSEEQERKPTLLNEEDGLVYKTVIDEVNDISVDASIKDVRPRARNAIKVSNLHKDDVVLVNYNIEEPKKLGHWYDFCVDEVKVKRGRAELKGTLLLGRDETPLHDIKIWYLDELYKIEKPYLLKSRSLADEQIMESSSPIKKQSFNRCDKCNDDPNKKCKECSCCVCGGKKEPEKQILCDECDEAYHLGCLKPPLDQLPDDEWYCPSCKNDENEIVKAGERLKESKKKAKMPSKRSDKKRDWDSGMACIGRTKECTLVPPNHYGPIPGVEVGQAWMYRVQVSEAGIHRPHVAGIHGHETDGVYSLVLSGGYEDDEDNGDEFCYTGSGGRDLSGNKPTASQSSDQKLTRVNKALALNCDAELNEKGAEAKDWKKGKPVRVVRNYKLGKHSKYAPKWGNRYDGIYKVVRYFPEKGKSGFIIWRYVLRRDDPDPAPWTPEGKKRIENLGLQIPEAPEGYKPEDQEDDRENSVTKSKKRKRSTQDGVDELPKEKKKKVEAYRLSDREAKLIEMDKLNKKRWEDCCSALREGKVKFLSVLQEAFECVICLDLVRNPVTTPCKHNICSSCLNRARSSNVLTCPCCRADLGSDFVANINENLKDFLCEMFPGYADK